MRHCLLFFTCWSAVFADRRILENYEKKLNDAVSSTTSGKVIKRYRCVEEYVTVDDEDTTIGRTFTTSKAPKGAVVERRGKKKKMHGVSTTQVEITPLKSGKTGDSRSKTNDELIEEMLSSVSHKTTTSHSPIRPQLKRIPTTEEPSRRQPFTHELSRGVPISQLSPPVRPYYAARTNTFVDEYEDVEEENEDDYWEDVVPRRRYRRPRPYPHLFARTAEQFRPLRPLTFHAPIRRQYRPLVPPQPLAIIQRSQVPFIQNLPPSTLSPIQQPLRPASVVPQPLVTSPPRQQMPPAASLMEKANPETCAKMASMASNFGIKDVSSFAKNNCGFLQSMAPGTTCEQISRFVDSCYKSRFL